MNGRVQRTDDIRAKTQSLDSAGGEVFDHDVGLFGHGLHEFDAARVLQIDRDGALVGVVLQKVIGVLTGLAPAVRPGSPDLGFSIFTTSAPIRRVLRCTMARPRTG